MGRPAFVPPKWKKPAPLGYGPAVDSVGTVAAPLLSGFSLASAVLVANNADDFRWPGAAMLALTIAAVTLIGAVECAFHARKYLWSEADVRAWWPEMEVGSELETLLRAEQAKAMRRWKAWTTWMRAAYDAGILALLAGLGLTLAPQSGIGTQAGLRWTASCVAFAACAAEASLLVASCWQRAHGAFMAGRSSRTTPRN